MLQAPKSLLVKSARMSAYGRKAQVKPFLQLLLSSPAKCTSPVASASTGQSQPALLTGLPRGQHNLILTDS